MVVYLQTFARVAGDVASGVMLSYVMQKLATAPHVKNGLHFAKIDGAEWDSVCFLSRHQIQRAARVWIAHKVLGVEKAGRFRLYSINLLALDQCVVTHWDNTADYRLCLKSFKKEEEQEQKLLTLPISGSIESNGVQEMNAAQIKAQWEANRAGRALPLDVGMRWMRAHGNLYGFVKPLTMAELGQLKHPTRHVGLDEYTRAMEWAVKHWGEFVHAVKLATGIHSGPDKPGVGYFAKHYAIAINAASKAQAAPELQSMQAIAEVRAPAVAPAVEEVDTAGIDALLGALK